MATKDSRVNSSIAEAAEFARPIFKHLRKTIHQGCPTTVETIKWGCLFLNIAHLPKDAVLFACVRAAVEQRDSPLSKIKRARKPANERPVPPDLKIAFAANANAAKAFKNFAPSHRRAYFYWIEDAKRRAGK